MVKKNFFFFNIVDGGWFILNDIDCDYKRVKKYFEFRYLLNVVNIFILFY